MSFLNKIQKYINFEQQKSIFNTKDKQVYVSTKKLSEETEHNPSEPWPAIFARPNINSF